MDLGFGIQDLVIKNEKFRFVLNFFNFEFRISNFGFIVDVMAKNI